MTDLRTRYQEAETAFARGEWKTALAGHLAVVRAAPGFAAARFRIADALLNLGHRSEAKAVYRGLAWHHIRGGQPLAGLVATKMLLALDPELDDLLAILAELYSSESDRTGDVDVTPPVGLPEGAAGEVSEDGRVLLEVAAAEAGNMDGITVVPEVLPPIPLFSHLTEQAFFTVLESLRLRRFANGEAIIREGEVGDAFYMLAEGQVNVTRSVGSQEALLARLGRGAVFGEMALVSRAARQATVRANGDVDVLELDRADLEAHAGQLESVKQALKKFTRGRFLANLAATSPLFQALARPDRRALMGRFRPQRVFPGDILIEEGEAGRGLFLILTGQMGVAAGSSNLAQLRSGDVFGEISLLHQAPTTATVTAESAGELLFLPREDFGEVLAIYPAVAETLRAMSSERLAQRFGSNSDVSTDDASVMV
ncbi:MAG: cyclic nucleotide-binding domain-containing protein [Myxococcota bacterium]